MGVLTQLRVFRKCNGTENNYPAQWDRVINNIKHFKVNQTSKLWSWFKNHSILPQIILGRGTWPSYFWAFRIYGFLPFSVVLKAVILLFSFCCFLFLRQKLRVSQNSENLHQRIAFHEIHAIVKSTGILPSLQLNKDSERAKLSGFYIRFSLSGINLGMNVVLMFSSSSAFITVDETASADFSETWGRPSWAMGFFSTSLCSENSSVLCDSFQLTLNMGNLMEEKDFNVRSN